MEEGKLGEERAAQRGSERVLAKARAQRKRREQQRQVLPLFLATLLEEISVSVMTQLSFKACGVKYSYMEAPEVSVRQEPPSSLLDLKAIVAIIRAPGLPLANNTTEILSSSLL